MRAVVIYESMFGNTHAVAQHIAEGIDSEATATVVSVHDATPEVIAGDLGLAAVQCHGHEDGRGAHGEKG